METSDVGERRRAIRAERERRAEHSGADEPPPPPPTPLVRPYARVTSPTGATAGSGLGEEDPDLGVAAGTAEAPAAPDPATPPMAEPFAPEPFAAEPFSTEPEAEPKAAEPPGWSLFTPVVPPEPPAYDDEAYRSIPAPASPMPSEPFGHEPAARAERHEPRVDRAAEGAPWPGPPAPDSRPPEEADEWAELSLRVGDDDAWLRALRGSLLAPGAAHDLDPDHDPDEPAMPEPVPPPAGDVAQGAARAEVVAQDVVPDEVVADGAAPDDVPPDGAVADDVVPDQGETLRGEARDDVLADGASREDGLPFAPDEPAPAVDDRPLVAPPSPFRRPPAERLTRALSDDPTARPDGPSTEADEGDEHVRGTLEPVLRRSTARAKVTPVIQPPEPTEADDALRVVRAAPVSWDEAMAANVVPVGKAGGRRLARARHESAGTEDYRPRPGADRSLTLLVLSMLLMLAVLVGLAVWAFWPRVIGARSVPPVGVTGMPTAQHG